MGEPVREFCRKDWDLDFRAELYKAEFFATRAWAIKRNDLVAPWSRSTRAELEDLRTLQRKERAAHTGEIIREQQGTVMVGYFYDVLAVSPVDSPRTAELLRAAVYLAGAVATYVKARFNRVRPWMLAPELSPPVPLPGYPSYPGGHATQMHLLALMLTELRPPAEKEVAAVACRVAKNRQRAGLNYESDTKAGYGVARQVWEILKTDCPLFKSTLAEARAELSTRLASASTAASGLTDQPQDAR